MPKILEIVFTIFHSIVTHTVIMIEPGYGYIDMDIWVYRYGYMDIQIWIYGYIDNF